MKYTKVWVFGLLVLINFSFKTTSYSLDDLEITYILQGNEMEITFKNNGSGVLAFDFIIHQDEVLHLSGEATLNPGEEKKVSFEVAANSIISLLVTDNSAGAFSNFRLFHFSLL